MILGLDEIFGFCGDPANKDCVDKGGTLQSDHKLHVTGEGFKTYLKQIKGYEDGEDKEIRDQLSQPATVDILKIIIDELSRWKNTQGTNKKYHLKDKEKETAFVDMLDGVWKNTSLDDFITGFFDKAIFTEFNGFAVVTKPKVDIENKLVEREGITERWDEKNVAPYIIFVSILDVKDYKITGDEVEYLIWKVGEEMDGEAVVAEIFRAIDDSTDRIIRVPMSGKDATLESELPNELGYVPAIQLSPIKHELTKDEVKTSPISHIIPMLDRYLSKDSFQTLTEIKHAFPKFVSVAFDCPKCHGTGEVINKTGDSVECTKCGGLGKIAPFKKGSFMAIKDKVEEGHIFPPGAPATYITPDIESIRYGSESLETLKQRILFAGTGNKALVAEEIAKTATESVINHKSLEDRIGEVLDAVESRETFLTDTIAKSHLDFKGSYEGCTIKYGRKLNLRDENTVLTEIIESKKAGMPESHIESLQKELIASRYKNSPESRERFLLLADIEPLCGYTVKETLDMSEYIDPEMLKLKINFNERVDQFEKENGLITEYKPDMDHDTRVLEVRTKLLEYGNDSGTGTGQELQGGVSGQVAD